MKVAIIGGTGIIGEGLSRVAAAAGHTVFVLSRRGAPFRVAHGLEGVHYVRGDAYDLADLEAFGATARFDAVVDLLSFNPRQLSRSLDVFALRCGQYVFASSATVYGDTLPQECLSETDTVDPGAWNYPLLKLDCEELLRTRCEAVAQNFTIVRPYITYGPSRLGFGIWEAGDMFSRLLSGLPMVIGDEVAFARTSVTHAHDLARGIVALLGNASAQNEMFNIASDENITWQQIYATAADAMGVTPQILSAPVQLVLADFPELAGKAVDRTRNRQFSMQKLRDACPGFEFSYTAEQGYAEVVQSMLAQGAPDNGPRHQGRIDRLARRAQSSLMVRRQIEQSHHALLTSDPKAYIKRQLGYRPRINSAAVAISRWRREDGGSASPYDIG